MVLLMLSWFEDADGDPHIFYDEGCKSSIESIEIIDTKEIRSTIKRRAFKRW